MTLRILASALALTTALCGLGCVQCNDIGCGGGFEWNASRADESPITPGTYVFTLGLEDDVFEISCSIGESYETSDCQPALRIIGEVEWNIDMNPTMTDGGDWDPTSPVIGWYLHVSDTSGSDPSGSYSETRGPTEVDILVTHEGLELFGIGYDVEYERDDDYRGDPACGFCDETQSRSFTW